MRNNKFDFLKKYLILLAFVVISSCKPQIDYDAIIEEYSSSKLLCISLLETNNVYIARDAAATSALETNNVYIYKGNPYSGSCLVYDKSHTTKIRLDSYVDGKQQGVSIGYYPTGEVEFIGYRGENSEINGEYVKFHQNGEIATIGQFKDGKYVGIFKFYDEAGELIETIKYNKFGILLKNKKY
jgi:antitoxin component YwqK of YwqJK toxin-antitoxin module